MQPEFDIVCYNERLNALFSRFQSVQKVGFTGDAYKPGLSGMERLSALLGDPWKAYPCVHIAGTNGKGSVCSMLAAALAAGGVTGGAVRSATATHGLTQKTSANGTARHLGEDALKEEATTSHKGSLVRALPGRMTLNGPTCHLGEDAQAEVLDVTARRVGLYTSPHLLDFRERMKIVSGDGFEMISREEVWEFLNKYEAELEGLSFFEVTTGMAFWWFAKRGVDAAVIEAGLGGRLDSTNIITPVLSVITSIGLDHCALLGSTRALIAGEKAGIFKPGVPAVVGVRDDETAPVFEAAAASVGCPLVFASDVPKFDDESDLLDRLDLTGPCQNLNLHTVLVSLASDLPQKTAIMGKVPVFQVPPSPKTSEIGEGPGVLDATFPKNEENWGRSAEPTIDSTKMGVFGGNSADFGVDSTKMGISVETAKAIAESGKRTGLWGRWQRVCREPEVICDIGHNPPALKENFARLAALQRGKGHQAETAQEASVLQRGTGLQENGQRPRQLIIVYGIMADKDLAGIAPMMPAGARYILTAPDSPRSMPAEELAARLAELRPDIAVIKGDGTVCTASKAGVNAISSGASKAIIVPSVADAVRRALTLAQDLPKPLIYIGGSTFVVAEALPLFNENTEP